MDKGKGKILSFGELLLRFTPDASGNWLKENRLPFFVGGAEANVATALALWNIPSAYLTAVPENAVTEQLISYLDELKIDTSPIVKQGERLGTFYLTKGKDMKNAGVVYDRAYSSYSQLQSGQIDWNEVFADVEWFHFSAICPALTQNVADVCMEALQAAKKNGVKVSLDLNYREKLWKYGKQPIEIMPQLAQYCTLIMGNIWAANKMLGIEIDEQKITSGSREGYLAQAEQTSKDIIEKFPLVRIVANTFRFDKESSVNYYSAMYADSKLVVSAEYNSDNILDKVGSGDCFMAGLLYGDYNGLSKEDTLAFATAAAFDKLFIPSDATTSSVEDIKNRMQ
ncbi:sugar kinase [Pedobacter sp. HMF7647]|uniref:Sugar kinase n=1 Tax=Hufsiella arboris TaxID=2695275 RepID=A0A7K1Y5U9_9SPHI|nr:sugar kinase [Hufsiella arboris]MXV49479.1 sugar kinase [Hufsiella arboris]